MGKFSKEFRLWNVRLRSTDWYQVIADALDGFGHERYNTTLRQNCELCSKNAKLKSITLY